MCEKCPNTKHKDVSCPKIGKYGPEKTQYLDTFHAMLAMVIWQLKGSLQQLKSNCVNAQVRSN